MEKIEYEIKEDIDFYEYGIDREICHGMGSGYSYGSDYNERFMNDDYFLMLSSTPPLNSEPKL